MSDTQSTGTYDAPNISKAEYEVLKVLWKSEKQRIREVHDSLHNGCAYSTTKTVMDRMVRKGLLARENFHGVFLYRALISRPAGLVKLLRFFADSVLETDYAQVVSMFASNQSLSGEELRELSTLMEADSDN